MDYTGNEIGNLQNWKLTIGRHFADGYRSWAVSWLLFLEVLVTSLVRLSQFNSLNNGKIIVCQNLTYFPSIRPQPDRRDFREEGSYGEELYALGDRLQRQVSVSPRC